ncbi:SDR family oxidoreductase [Roseovarius atlanticus]|uniref:SDR family oxidoreductase n=1 Tax=Roseovarius atlanticus TaxID=1641875 RepID=UPI001C970444|nr:SDR family oxidoreductase [Roseovarius atlanticus]MBY5988351.1 SDR family oxidoreductase [Roseovarius atlanticus]MBY6123742.1 SDR family oxidoreductase [Roseovarius atlanticus]MBY6148237.1 SDR family oxidoreductase [Roseovarius atlanticus]
MTQIAGRTALVTGANRGIGKAFVEELLAAGAAKVYAAARNPDTLNDLVAKGAGKVVAVAIDVTNPDTIAAAARELTDVDLLINNAGVANFAGIVSAPDAAPARAEMEVNFFGVFDMTRAFAPILKSNGGGIIVNMGSIASFVNFPVLGSYSASKAAVHSLTQSTRAELAAQGTSVHGVYPGPIDTDLATRFPMDKTSPNAAVQAILAGVETGQDDIYPDPTALVMRDNLRADPKAVEKETGAMLPA